MRHVPSLLLLGMLLQAPALAVAPPDAVNYQGVLRDSANAPLTGTYDMAFAFYETPAGGTLLLLDEHLSTGTGGVPVQGGLFNVLLGTGQITGAIASMAELFRTYGTIYLEVRVGGETLNPRTQVVSSAYAHKAPHGVTFVHWGRTDCPGGAEVVYSGYAAANHQGNPGGGSNTVCLTSSPTWLVFNDADHNGASLWGTEFRTAGTGASTLVPLNNWDATCALCLQKAADVTFMLPGSATCPSGWATEYQGYLMATHNTQNDRELVCVDRDSVGRPGSSAGLDGNQWWPTEAECGSLPCLPYVNNREVTCAVCSR